MVKAVFLDFYGTVVYEDDKAIAYITNEIANTGNVKDKSEIGAYWYKEFCSLFSEANGVNFITQRELEYISLRKTLEKFGSDADCDKLCQILFDLWTAPEIYEDSKLFFQKCPVPVYIVSNIDTDDIAQALRFHGLKPADVITSEDAKAYKPHEDIFKLAISKTGFKPEEILHAGDSLYSDIKGAEAIGISAVWVNRKGRNVPDYVKRVSGDLIHILDMLK